jgi:putative ABC transport system permease protein
MRRVALKGLLHRKTRAVLTALAIVLGVSMMSGTYILTDTIDKAFDDIFTASYQDTSVVISGREIVKGSDTTVPASLLERVRRLPNVEAAAGSLMNLDSETESIQLLDSHGEPLGGEKAQAFGFGIDTSQPRFNPLELVEGSWAAGGDELVVDAGSAKDHGLAVGQTLDVASRGEKGRPFRISGIARYGSVDSLGGATIAVFTVPTAQSLFGKAGRLDSISLAARPGVSQAQLVREVRPHLPRSARIQTAEERARADAEDTKKFLSFIEYFLLAFAVIALVVGGFVIFNTLSITVAQRAREFATLRTLGASRRQILRSVLLEGAVIGVLASAAGLGLGLVLAKGLTAVLQALDMDLPRASTVFATRTAVVSMLVGVLISVLATLAPALRATRVPPIAAVREGAVIPGSRMSRSLPGIAAATLVVAVAALAIGSFSPSLSTGMTLLALGGGALVLFAGVALVAPRLVRPLAAVLGAPAHRLAGAPGALARENATRNPGRTATTAAALMIGLALVAAVATLGAGLRHSTTSALSDQVTADYVVTSEDGLQRFAKQAGRALPAIPGVGAASVVLDEQARALGKDVSVNGIDPDTIGRTYRFHWAPGSSPAALDAIGADGAIVKQSFADKHRLRVGSPLEVTAPSGRRLSLRVRGIHAPPVFDKISPVLGPVAISHEAFRRAFPRGKVLYGLLDVEPGAAAAAPGALQRAVRAVPGAKLQTRDEWVSERAAAINQLLNLLYVLLALSIVVSLFGMVNTLVLAVFERTRELGMLRTIGMTRRQVRRMVRHESSITALIGAGLGLPVGLFLAAAVTRALADQGLQMAVPVGMLAAFVLAALVAGLLAAVLPARRAARLNVLEALHYE